MFFGQSFERVNVGRIAAGFVFAPAFELQFVEQNHLQLFGRADVELLARALPNFGLQTCGVGFEFGAQIAQNSRFEQHSHALHLRQNIGQRQLDLVEQIERADLFQFGPKQRFKQRQNRDLSGIVRALLGQTRLCLRVGGLVFVVE